MRNTSPNELLGVCATGCERAFPLKNPEPLTHGCFGDSFDE